MHYSGPLAFDKRMSTSLGVKDWHELFNALPGALLLVNKAGCVLLANKAAQVIFGYAESEICGLEVEVLVPSSHSQARHGLCLNAFFARPGRRFIGDGKRPVLLTRDGQEKTADIELSPITLRGCLYGLVSVNITNQRHQAEQALQVSEARMMLARQAVGLAVFDCDCQQKIIHCDEWLGELLGGGSEEILTHESFLKIVHPDDVQVYQRALKKAMDPDGSGKLRVECRVVDPNSIEQRWIVIVGSVSFEKGLAKRILGVARDITERKALEKRTLAQRAEAEIFFKQQVALSTASAIAHQLNSPLTAISIYSEAVLHLLQNGNINSDKMEHAVRSCIKQAQSAGRGLHELLAFLQKGQVSIETLDCNEIVMDAIQEAHDIDPSEFALSLDLQSDLPPIRANRIQVQKILLNLIGNALEAIRSAGIPKEKISICTKSLPEQNMVKVTVQDNGPGLDEKLVKYVFEPFFTTKETGVGIGLPICRELIELSGGHLWLDSESDSGARFHFTLPFA
jgi:two-component system sensor kinase FixL